MKKSVKQAATKKTIERNSHRNEKTGVVVSQKMKDTIIVEVYRVLSHEKYGKFYRRSNTFVAQNTKSEAKLGDRVRIQETRPLSKSKRWKLIEVVTKAGEQGVEI